MAKGIVIIDIPNCCGGCSLIDIDEDMNLYCGSTSLYIDINKLQSKPDWCPIKEIPVRLDEIKYPHSMNDYQMKGFSRGCNACIDEILKGE